MQSNGWSFDTWLYSSLQQPLDPVTHQDIPHYTKKSNLCQGGDVYYAGASGWSPASIKATLIGSGNATLKFGNCNNFNPSATVAVFLNGNELGSAKYGVLKTSIKFSYSKGDVLNVKLLDGGLAKLHSFDFDCWPSNQNGDESYVRCTFDRNKWGPDAGDDWTKWVCD